MSEQVKQIVVLMGGKDPKKHSVRYNASEPNSIIDSIYIKNEGVAKLGNPSVIKITIESATE